MECTQWTNENVLRFLELYQKHPCIWDPKHPLHKNRTDVNDAWIRIRNAMGGACTVKELKNKKESLMSAYRAYRTKIARSEAAGDGTEVYQPTWFAYSLMDSFLARVYKCSLSLDGQEDSQDRLEYSKNETSDTDDQSGETEISNICQLSSQPFPEYHCSNQPRKMSKMAKRWQWQYEPAEPQQITNQMEQSEDHRRSVYQKRRIQEEEDDECTIFGNLIEKKLRKLPEHRRNYMMVKMNQLFYEESLQYSSHVPTSTIVIQQAGSPCQIKEDPL